MRFYQRSNTIIREVYNYLQRVCEKEKDWVHHLSAIAMRHNSSSIAGSRIFSPYMIFTGRHLSIPIGPKLLRSQFTGVTPIDKYVRELLLRLEHIREMARLNILDFKESHIKAFDKKHHAKPTKLRDGDRVYVARKCMKIGGSKHLTPNYIGPFVIVEKIGKFSFKRLRDDEGTSFTSAFILSQVCFTRTT